MKTIDSPVPTLQIHYQPTPSTLADLGVNQWPIWQKTPSSFEWYYETQERCYLLTGKVIVMPQNAEAVTLTAGDLVTFPKGMHCTWQILETVSKHYQLDSLHFLHR
jgi:hypothetical protein